MKISLEGAAQVRLIPENKEEREELETLWLVLVQGGDCKVLSPVGSYRADEEGAGFVVQEPVSSAH